MIGRKLVAFAAGMALVVTTAACSSERNLSTPVPANSAENGAPTEGGTVGVAMPTRQNERWVADGDNVKSALEAAGYQVDLQFAQDDIPTQVNQIDNMITGGVDLLIIAAIDGSALTGQLQDAADAGIRVISYDRLIRDSENVDYYATFDNFKVGQQQATSLLVGLGLEDGEGEPKFTSGGPYNIELFAGSPDDNNATFFFNGAMEVLQPLIDDGTLVVGSGQTDFNTVAILRWEPATAQARMDNLLSSTYSSGKRVDAVLSPNDGLAIGILSALRGAGYGSADRPYPVVTGQDADVASVKSIIAGEQYATIFKDTRKLADTAVAMASALLSGEEPEVNDTESYDNGVKVVPTMLLEPVNVYASNYQEILIDGGYYTVEELQ